MADPIEIIERYTYADYVNWPEELRCELIEGVIYLMASPTEWHQDVVMELAFQLKAFLKDKKCKVMISPFDVRLFPKEDDKDSTVVIPDLIVVCDKKKLSDGKACRGAPDFVIEVISPSTEKRDLLAKKTLYAKAGVKECWFIDRKTLTKCTLNDGSYTETVIHYLFNKAAVPVETLPECNLAIPVIE